MSGSVTLASLTARARQRADLVNNENVSDAEAESYVNQSLAELYDIIVQADEDYFTIWKPIIALPGVGTYDMSLLSPQLLKLRGIDIPWNGTMYNLTAGRIEFGERNDLNGPLPTYSMGFPSRFYMTGTNITLLPTPTTGFTGKIWYVPKPPVLSGAATFDCQSGWDEFIVVDAARKMLVKQERDSGPLAQEREALRSHIIASYRRDFSGPKRVTRRRYRNAIYPYGKRLL